LFEQVARSLDAYYVDFAPAQMMPEDFGGMPTNTPDGFVYEMMATLKKANAAPSAIINLDEMSNVPRSTQAGMLRFIHTRRCGDYKLGDHVRIGGAMNPTSTATDAQETAIALANRVAWIPWKRVTAKEHAAYVIGNGADTELDLPTFDSEAYKDALRDVSAIYAAYMDARGVLDEDPDKDPRIFARTPLAYATPRSWEAFVRVAATCRMFNDFEALKTLGEGIVGPPQALEFSAFYADADLPNPEAWLKDAKLFTHDPRRPDRTFAACTALALCAVDKERTEKMKDAEKLDRWNAAWAGLQCMRDAEAQKTAIALAGQTLAQNKPKGALLASVEKLIKELAIVIRAAGFQSTPTIK
jgi:hypothetical protein